MIHKGQFFTILPLLALLLLLDPFGTRAERRSVAIMETSSSGKLVRVSLGARQGITLGEPVLFSASTKKIAAGRVIRVDNDNAVVAVMEKYGSESPVPDADYEILYGEPFEEAANLPDYVSDREDERDNPTNEKFWTQNGEEVTPELDDDTYTPEIKLRPKLPSPRTFSPHNITVGLDIFRNRALPASTDKSGNLSTSSSQTTYNGYSFRYAYTFRSHYWLKTQTPALISAEFGVGVYSFDHTFPKSIRASTRPDGTVIDGTAGVRVVPLQAELRYLVEVSKLFRLYPYLGYQYNIVSATDGSLTGLEPLMGGRILGGAGAVLVMSDTIDGRIEGGSDGVLGGIVVKF